MHLLARAALVATGRHGCRCPSSSLVRALSSSSPSSSSAATPPAASTASKKVPIALISEIRSLRPGTPLASARSALLASSLSVPGALSWLAAEAERTGAAKALKLSSREAGEGLVGVAVLNDGLQGSHADAGVRAAMVELSCETDFVARTDEFRELVEDVSVALAFFAEPSSSSEGEGFIQVSQEEAAATPLVSVPPPPPPVAVASAESSQTTTTTTTTEVPTVASALRGVISRLGENIHLRRACVLSLPPSSASSSSSSDDKSVLATYTHAALPSSSTTTRFAAGPLASLVLLRMTPTATATVTEGKEGGKELLRALARQVVALPTSSVSSSSSSSSAPSSDEAEGPSTALLDQEFITFPSTSPLFEDLKLSEAEGQQKTVKEVLDAWEKARGGKVEVRQLRRWEVGGELEG